MHNSSRSLRKLQKNFAVRINRKGNKDHAKDAKKIDLMKNTGCVLQKFRLIKPDRSESRFYRDKADSGADVAI